MASTVGELVRERRLLKGLTQSDLALQTGLRQAYISQVEKGEIAIPRDHNLDALGAALGLTRGDFYRAAGMLDGIEDAPRTSADPRAPYDPETAALAEIGRQVMRLVQEQVNVRPQGWRTAGPGSRRFPIINTVPASDATVRDSQLEEEIDIPDAFWLGAGDPQVYRVTGDCMTGARIFSGNTIIIDAAKTEPNEGQIVVAQVNGGLTLKRFYRTASGVELRPDAPVYESIFVKRSDDLIICGVLHKVYDGGER